MLVVVGLIVVCLFSWFLEGLIGLLSRATFGAQGRALSRFLFLYEGGCLFVLCVTRVLLLYSGRDVLLLFLFGRFKLEGGGSPACC